MAEQMDLLKTLSAMVPEANTLQLPEVNEKELRKKRILELMHKLNNQAKEVEEKLKRI